MVRSLFFWNWCVYVQTVSRRLYNWYDFYSVWIQQEWKSVTNVVLKAIILFASCLHSYIYFERAIYTEHRLYAESCSVYNPPFPLNRWIEWETESEWGGVRRKETCKTANEWWMWWCLTYINIYTIWMYTSVRNTLMCVCARAVYMYNLCNTYDEYSATVVAGGGEHACMAHTMHQQWNVESKQQHHTLFKNR